MTIKCISLSLLLYLSSYGMLYRPMPQKSVQKSQVKHQSRLYSSSSYNISNLNTCIYTPENAKKFPAHVLAVQHYFQNKIEKEATVAMNELCSFRQVTAEQLKEKLIKESSQKARLTGESHFFSVVPRRLEKRIRRELEPEFKLIEIYTVYDNDLSMNACLSENALAIPDHYEYARNSRIKKYLIQAMGHLAHQDYLMPDDGDNEDIGYDWARVVPDNVKDFLRRRAQIWTLTRGVRQAREGVLLYQQLYPDVQPHEESKEHRLDCQMLKDASEIYSMMSEELLNEREGR